MLMKPEYRDKLDAKYKKKIESTVRRPPKDSADPEEDLSPCPFCDTSIPSTLLVCLGCKQHIPICIVTVSYTCNLNSKFHHLIKCYILQGMHLVKGDLTRCPSCHFMAIRSKFIQYATNSRYTMQSFNYKINVTYF